MFTTLLVGKKVGSHQIKNRELKLTLNFKSARLKKRRKFQKLVFGNRRERKTERKKDREKESQREREIESEKRE